jgi:hypothetical protein
MKYRALLSATAIVSSTFTTTAAFASASSYSTQQPAPDGLTDTSGMQTQCSALAAAHDTQNGDIWAAVVVPGAATITAGPTETGNRVIDQSSIAPLGTYVPAHQEIRGNPYKNGGSVNMFGDQWSTAGYYPDSTYNFSADFSSTFSYAFSCNITDAVYHPAYDDPAVPVQGFYVVDPAAPGNSETNRQNCDAFTALGDQNPRPDWWGTTHAFCDFVKTADAIPPVHHNAYNSPPVLVDNEAGTAITQNETDNLTGFEPHGGILQVTGEHFDGSVVICISPGSKGGSWRAQNGYNGGSFSGAGNPAAAGCNTPYFKVAPWGSGSHTSQGTFISVPNYSY